MISQERCRAILGKDSDGMDELLPLTDPFNHERTSDVVKTKGVSRKSIYTVREISELTGKSENLIYRRLTEKPKKYLVRFARKEGERWVFNKKLVDEAIANGESIIVRADAADCIDDDTVVNYFSGKSKSCGKKAA